MIVKSLFVWVHGQSHRITIDKEEYKIPGYKNNQEILLKK